MLSKHPSLLLVSNTFSFVSYQLAEWFTSGWLDSCAALAGRSCVISGESFCYFFLCTSFILDGLIQPL